MTYHIGIGVHDLSGPAAEVGMMGMSLVDVAMVGRLSEASLAALGIANTFAFLVAHFGLGAADRIEKVVILWPDGTRSVRRNVPINRHLTIQSPALQPR